jgi:ResB-like family
MNPTSTIDPLEQRDPWRLVWRTLTSQVVLWPLIVLTAAAALAIWFLPQLPAADADLGALNGWNARARALQGKWFDTFNASGLNAVAQSAWPRLVAITLVALAGARLFDRLSRLRRDDPMLHDETRMRVMDGSPPFALLTTRLQNRGYAVRALGESLNATRAPHAELPEIAIAAGAVALGSGLLLNIALGWSLIGRVLPPDVPLSVPEGRQLTLAGGTGTTDDISVQLGRADAAQTVALARGSTRSVDGVNVTLSDVYRGYRIRAETSAGAPLSLRTSNFVEPETEVLISFGVDAAASLAAPEAQLVLTLLRGAAPQDDQVVFTAVGSAAEISTTQIQPSMMVNDARFVFEPVQSALIDARHDPGNLPALIGAALVLLGAAGSLLWPSRRIVVRRRDTWTEFYAAGRGVRADVLDITSQT